MKNFKIFSGTASSDLAKRVAQILAVPLGKREIVRFADGECRVRIEEEVETASVFVIQSLCPPVDENLVELLLLGDTLKRNVAGELTAVIPYFGYTRQDKVHRKGECLSAQLVAEMIETVGFEEVITVDCHSQRALGFFKIPTQNLFPETIFDQKISGDLVMAPDKGAVHRAQRLAKIFRAQVGFLEKDRDLITGKIRITKIKGEVAGKTVVIADDMITSGGTVVLAAEVFKKAGASKIFVWATHPLLVKDAPKVLQASAVEKVFVSDTIPIPKEKRFAKLEIISVAPLIAEAIGK